MPLSHKTVDRDETYPFTINNVCNLAKCFILDSALNYITEIPVPSIKVVPQVPPSVGSWVTAIFGESNPNWYPGNKSCLRLLCLEDFWQSFTILGVITAVNNDQLTIKFLERSRKNYKWPIKDDIQIINYTEILCVLNHPPRSVSKSREHLFFIPQEENIDNMFKTQSLN